MEPNEQQRAVIDFGLAGKGSLNLIACAGTGKTTTLIELVKYLDGATWFCAFNKAIVSEIEYRVNNTVGINKDSIRVSTVHSAGFRAWNKHISPRRCKVDGRKLYGIIDELSEGDEIYVKHCNFIRKLVDYAKSAGFGILKRIHHVPDWYDLIDHFGMDVDEESSNGPPDYDKLIECAIKVYQESLKRCEREVDFSDMLLAPLHFQARFPKYDNILIDEAQDISPLRLKLILESLKPGGRVIAVGDPNQAIYGFTGADAESMETIKSATDAVDLFLSITYRCPKSVVAVAQQWVPRITAHESAPEGKVWACDLKAASPKGEGYVDYQHDPSAAKASFWDCGPFTSSEAILCRNVKPLVALA